MIMKKIEDILETLRKHKEELKRKYGVKEISIFGSFARGEERESSDVDILVEFEKPVGLEFFELWDELEELLGMKVDLLTVKAVKQKFLLWKSIESDLVYV